MNLKTLRDNAEELVREAGWPDDPILNARVPFDPPLTADLLLLYEQYPVAAVCFAETVDRAVADRQPIPILIADDNVVALIGSKVTWPSLPGPAELWRATRGDWMPETDARLAKCGSRLRAFQAFALAHSLDALGRGDTKVSVQLTSGAGRSVIAIGLLEKLHNSGRARRSLIVVDTNEESAELRQRLAKAGLTAWSAVDPWARDRSGVAVATSAYFFASGVNRYEEIVRFGADTTIVMNLRATESVARILHQLQAVPTIGFVSHADHAPPGFEHPVFSFGVEQVLAEQGDRGPTVRLGEVAEVMLGQQRLSPSIHMTTVRVPSIHGSDVAQGRDVPSDGYEVEVPRVQLADRRLRAGDLLLPRIGRPGVFRYVILTSEPARDTVAAASVIVIRPTTTTEDAAWIAQQLSSPESQRILAAQDAGAGALLNLRPNLLRELAIPLRPRLPAEDESPPTRVPTQLEVACSELEASLVELRTMIGAGASVSGDQTLVVATKLKDLARALAPPSVEDTVLSEFPTPIARAYRRFHDARFNVFERVLRLRDLGEAVMYFIYNAVLADYARRLDRTRCPLADRAVRLAYTGMSMAHRVTFVEQVANSFRNPSTKSDKLFFPMLPQTSFVERARTLQEFRNNLSHSAAASQSRSYALLEQLQPVVTALLQDVSFLAEARLVRMTGLHKASGRWVRRMELYRGVVPVPVEETSENDDVPSMSDHGHLVIVNDDDEVLDLHPLYQIFASKNTNYEAHLCFFKHRKGSILHGESSDSVAELELPGANEFTDLSASS